MNNIDFNDANVRATFWHSSAHVLGAAIEALYSNAKLTIGPSVDNGFYYDVDIDVSLNTDEVKRIENKMLEIINNGYNFVQKMIPREEAIEYYRNKHNEYKCEILEGINDPNVSIYQQGDFSDLCRGPHISNTSLIKSIKITNIAAAYWRGNCKNKQLTRVYGISFPTEEMMTQYWEMLEEASKRDHQKIAKTLKLYTFSEKVGLGLPLWLPRGTAMREQLEKFLRRAQRIAGYKQVITPHIGNKALYITSGHYEKYGKDSFQPIHTPDDGEEFFLKPMNCPHHCEIYNSEPRSYRDLPLRLAEFGTVYRYEQHGELHGLTRTRCFTQDDAHIFCRPDQVENEFKNVIELVIYVFNKLGFDNYEARLSFRDQHDHSKYIGDMKDWDIAEAAIEHVATEKDLPTVKAYNEAAFYGPKLDFMVKDSLGRKWQLGTVQLDYQLPHRFKLVYTGEDGAEHCPVMIHRAPFGSFERFIAVLLEHTMGKLPVWLAPEQVIILPISKKFIEYSDEIYDLLTNEGIRCSLDSRDERISRKIRDAEIMKIPYLVIIGEKEASNKTLSVRCQNDTTVKNINELIEEIKDKEN